MAGSATLTPFWTYLRFAFEARSLDAAAADLLDGLIGLALARA